LNEKQNKTETTATPSTKLGVGILHALLKENKERNFKYNKMK